MAVSTDARGVIVECRSCGQKNRIGFSHLDGSAKCGKCKTELSPIDAPIDVDESTFDHIVRESPVPVLVDFWAEWCGPCQMAAPEVKHVAHDLAGRAVVLKVNTEESPRLAARYNVRGIPSFAVFRGGKLVQQKAGLVNRTVLRSMVE